MMLKYVAGHPVFGDECGLLYGASLMFKVVRILLLPCVVYQYILVSGE